jgi:hypothetical protein
MSGGNNTTGLNRKRSDANVSWWKFYSAYRALRCSLREFGTGYGGHFPPGRHAGERSKKWRRNALAQLQIPEAPSYSSFKPIPTNAQ